MSTHSPRHTKKRSLAFDGSVVTLVGFVVHVFGFESAEMAHDTWESMFRNGRYPGLDEVAVRPSFSALGTILMVLGATLVALHVHHRLASEHAKQ